MFFSIKFICYKKLLFLNVITSSQQRLDVSTSQVNIPFVFFCKLTERDNKPLLYVNNTITILHSKNLDEKN